jgi:predicted DNA-binding helix-hairpin-helix protein
MGDSMEIAFLERSARRRAAAPPEWVIRQSIVTGMGGRRVFRFLLPETCRYSCSFCPLGNQDFASALIDPESVARIFLSAYRRGLCDGLFLTCGLPKDPVLAVRRSLRLVEKLRVTHGYLGYLHAKVPAGVEPALLERLVRLVDRVSYHLEPCCVRAVQESGAASVSLLRDVQAASDDVRAAREISARSGPPPLRIRPRPRVARTGNGGNKLL